MPFVFTPTTPEQIAVDGQLVTLSTIYMLTYGWFHPVVEPAFAKRRPDYSSHLRICIQEGFLDGGTFVLKRERILFLHDDPTLTPPDDEVLTTAEGAAPTEGSRLEDRKKQLWDLLVSEGHVPAGAIG